MRTSSIMSLLFLVFVTVFSVVAEGIDAVRGRTLINVDAFHRNLFPAGLTDKLKFKGESSPYIGADSGLYARNPFDERLSAESRAIMAFNGRFH